MTKEIKIKYEEGERIWREILKIPPFAELDKERWEELVKELRSIIFCIK